MKYAALIVLLLICIFLEATFVSLPLSLIVLFLYTIFWQDEMIFILAIGCGVILDSLLFRAVGITSIFYVLFLGLVLLYRQKFEIQTLPFAIFFSSAGCVGYILLFGNTNLFSQLFLTILITLGSYLMIKSFVYKGIK